MIHRSIETAEFRAEQRDDEKIIEGYFAVFDKPYFIDENTVETVARGAFDDAIDGDVKALINHDARFVLGRTTADTLELRVDNVGLFGRIVINPKDSDAVNCYERVKRGDISQCSFGFDIIDQATELRDDGSVHFEIRKVKLYEVSCVAFPAYRDSSCSARSAEAEAIRKMHAWKATQYKKLMEAKNGVEVN